MPDTGYRSVEVNVTNDTEANLTIQEVSANEGSWIQGETPTQGQVLDQWTAVKWGISTDDYNGGVDGQVSLTGYGYGPITISFFNDSTDNSKCTVDGNDKITGTATQISTGEQNHAEWKVKLVPATSQN